jgi:hypothetical protein
MTGSWLFTDIPGVFPKEGQMRLAGQATRKNKSEIFWASDHRNSLFSDLEGYPRKLA